MGRRMWEGILVTRMLGVKLNTMEDLAWRLSPGVEPPLALLARKPQTQLPTRGERGSTRR